MNKIKEKKLNTIKSDILEIKDFVMSNDVVNKKQTSSDDNLNGKADDTITLKKIVDFENNEQNSNILVKIKQDLDLLKSTLIEHERILKEILIKIK